jgi:hypothetical protein
MPAYDYCDHSRNQDDLTVSAETACNGSATGASDLAFVSTYRIYIPAAIGKAVSFRCIAVTRAKVRIQNTVLAQVGPKAGPYSRAKAAGTTSCLTRREITAVSTKSLINVRSVFFKRQNRTDRFANQRDCHEIRILVGGSETWCVRKSDLQLGI